MQRYEYIAFQVNGPKVYFSSPWNWFDQLAVIIYIAFSCAMISQQIAQADDDHEETTLEKLLRLLKVSILLSIWIKITYFQ